MQTIQNPRLYVRRKASAEGRAPRTMEEAFPHYPGLGYQDPPLADKIGDVVAIALTVGAFGLVAYFGPSLFSGMTMATTSAWIDDARDGGYSTLFSEVCGGGGRYVISSGMGPLDRAVLVSQGDFRLFLDADVARMLGEQLIAAADHYEAQRREAQS